MPEGYVFAGDCFDAATNRKTTCNPDAQAPETDKALRIASAGSSCLSSTDFESTGTGYGMKIGYRTDHRQPLDIGDIMEAAGDHLDVAEFPDISRKAEMALRNSSQHTDIRANALYLYSDLHMAEEDWRLRGNGVRTFYKVSFEDDDLLHTGDFFPSNLAQKTFERPTIPLQKSRSIGPDVTPPDIRSIWSVRRRFLRLFGKPQAGKHITKPPRISFGANPATRTGTE